jgi:NTP pyrophosphatase (non-canonical NTP hydrolase)
MPSHYLERQRRLRRLYTKQSISIGNFRRKSMNFDKYQQLALKTAIYPKEIGLLYTALGLGESGEIQNKVKKIYRDGVKLDKKVKQMLAAELGDLLWYCATFAKEIGWSLDDVACLNIEKLKSRQKRNKLQGEGDSR